MTSYFNFTGGQNSNVSPFLTPQDSVVLLRNTRCDIILGALIKDLGFSMMTAEIPTTKPATGLGVYKSYAGTSTSIKILATTSNIAASALTLYAYSGTAWTNISLAAAWDSFQAANVEMANFIGYQFFVGGTAGAFLPVGSLTSTTFSTATNVTGMPQARDIVRYRDRLYVTNCRLSSTNYPFRTHFSSIPSAGAITWTATDFFDTDHGEETVAIESNFDKLFIFTNTNTYFYDQSQLKKAWDIGTPARRTVVADGVNLIWTNQYGVWVSVNGGFPQNIGGPILDYILNAARSSSADPSTWSAAIVNETYYLYLDYTYDNDFSYTNGLLCAFHFPTGTWRIGDWNNKYSMIAQGIDFYSDTNNTQFLMAAHNTYGKILRKSEFNDVSPTTSDIGATYYGDSTTQFDVTNPAGATFRYTYDGTGTDPGITATTFPTSSTIGIFSPNFNAANTGNFTVTASGANYFEVTNAAGVIESDKTLSTGVLYKQFAVGITSEIIFPPLKLGTYGEQVKIDKIIAYSENTTGMTLYYRILTKENRVWSAFKSLGDIQKYVNTFDTQTMEGNLIQLKICHVGTDTPFQFYGFEIELAQGTVD